MANLNKLLGWVMYRRLNAILVVTLLSAMPLLGPIANAFSGTIANALLCLVVLRMGVAEGSLVLAAVFLVTLMMSWVGVLGSGLVQAKAAILLLAFATALFLRISRSLFNTFVVLSCLSVVGFYGLTLGAWGDTAMDQYFPVATVASSPESGDTSSSLPLPDIEAGGRSAIDTTAEFESQTSRLGSDASADPLGGQGLDFTQRLNERFADPETRKSLQQLMLLMMLLADGLSALLLGRWFQAVCYNPGRFQSEFHGLVGDKFWIGLLAVSPILLNLALPGHGSVWVVAFQLPLLMLGISLVHAWVKQKQWVSGWLVLFYLTLPWTYLFAIMLGVADGFFSIKQGLGERKS